MTVILELRRQGQEDCNKHEDSLTYMVSSRSARAQIKIKGGKEGGREKRERLERWYMVQQLKARVALARDHLSSVPRTTWGSSQSL